MPNAGVFSALVKSFDQFHKEFCMWVNIIGKLKETGYWLSSIKISCLSNLQRGRGVDPSGNSNLSELRARGPPKR